MPRSSSETNFVSLGDEQRVGKSGRQFFFLGGIKCLLTLQVGTLLLAEVGARLLHSRRQGDLYVLGHGLLGPAHVPLCPRFPHHLLDPLDAAVALVEALGDILRQPFDLALLSLLGLLVIEARQHVLLVQAFQLLALAGDIG